MRRAAVSLALMLVACAPLRFVDRAPVWREHDDRPIAQPHATPPSVDWGAVRDTVFQPLDRVLKLDYGVEAVNVNALDEVPDSSWFHDPRRDSPAARARPRRLGDDEMYWGAARPDDVPLLPLYVVKAKAVGANPGFVARDARGVRYMIKLDPPGRPRFATSVEVVVSRLAWACGWLVPKEVMIEVPRAEVRLAVDATTRDEWDRAHPFTQADLDRLLDAVPRDADGRLPMLASVWLPGVSLGPFHYFGRRPDDGNDRWPHENRRELRGFAVFSAWVNNVDTLENNTLDMFEHGHVVHYEQDVGGAFAVWAGTSMQYWMGHETYFDAAHVFAALVSFGFASGYWEGEPFRAAGRARDAASPVLGGFEAEHFDPRAWRSNLPTAAFARATARDRYWAAKRIALVDARELGAAIAAGHYAPAIAEQLFAILWQRREKILRAFLSDVTALDHFRVEDGRLRWDDLWIDAGLGGQTRYDVRERGAGSYRVVELTAWRDGRRGRPVRVHVAGGHVVGVER